ncbi:AMP-binding protein [uncultured Lacinutrix sp.]|uniref:AMP-binding protein n=1 Tax=uncultured Lacinutrix sp. TaxID=574032 RepID=UPI0026243275|nr:AMP-binding protein [uncultured Lacinutrix sp.]
MNEPRVNVIPSNINLFNSTNTQTKSKEIKIPGGTFIKKEVANLSSKDQLLFQRFGQGPIQKVPYKLIHKAFEAQAYANPKCIAVEHLGKSITYQELNNQANKLAYYLSKQGVSKGDNIGLFVKRSIPMVVGMLAILKVGAAYVPQYVGVTPEKQLLHIVDNADIKIILTLKGDTKGIPVVSSCTYIAIDEFIETNIEKDNIANAFECRDIISSNDKAFLIFTSGTTGTPNGVQVSHCNVCNILLTAPGNLGMRPGLKVGQILNIAFDMMAWEVLGCLGNGATLVIRGKDIEETVQKVDIVISTPSILSTIDSEKCKNVKRVAVAGEPCPKTLADKWGAFSAFHNSCGPTETTIVNTVQRYYPTDELLTIGKPTPNNTVYILDKNLKPCPIGEIGEMWAGGDCVTLGYLGNSKLNKERYKPDPFLGNGRKMFRTRDLGRWTVNGELEHFGRTDDQVKIKGFRIELDSVSAILESMPSCKRAVALKYDSKTLIAFVSPKSIVEEKAKQEILKSLPYFCVPDKIISMEELPMTSRGKIDKRKLLDTSKSIYNG